jgi:hypothetical protein
MAAYLSTATGDIAEYMNSVAKVVFSNTLAAAAWDGRWKDRAFSFLPDGVEVIVNR